MGAATATLAGYSATVAMTFVVAQRYYRVDYQVGRMARIIVILCVVAAAVTVYQPSTAPLLVTWKAVLLVGAPAALWATGFFEPREKQAIRRLLRRPGVGGASA